MEERKEKNTEVKNEHRRASRIIFIVGIILVAAIVFALVTSIILLLFPVNEIEVVGDSRYNYSEIIEESGIKKGARLYYLNKDKVENAILSAFPYLKSVEINAYFPNRIKIEIEEFEDIYLLPHTEGFCYVNSNFEILEIVKEAPSYEMFSGIFIKLENSAEGDIGSIYKSEDVERASSLIEIIKANGFYDDLNIVDVRNKYNNSFVVGKKYKFVLGAMTDVNEKMSYVFKVRLDDSFDKEKNAIIDVTDGKKVILRYVNDENISDEFDFCQK